MEAVLIYGIITSMILSLWTVGLSLTYGISGLANFAHGALYVSAGFISWSFIHYTGLPFALSAIISILLAGLLGFGVYWGLLLRLRGIIFAEVIVTFVAGVAILQFLLWKGLYGYEYALPVFVKGTVEILGIPVDYQRLFIVGFGVALIAFLWFFTHNTRIGLAFRGIAQNELTAISLGIDSDWIGSLSLAFGSALAAVSAAVVLPLGLIEPNIGSEVLIYAVCVAVVGGMESIPGMILASFIIGFGQVVTATYWTPRCMTVVPLAAITLILAIRPSGLLGRFKELEERV
jgi:branched-chain amino acid transport system permease protein